MRKPRSVERLVCKLQGESVASVKERSLELGGGGEGGCVACSAGM